MTIKTFINVLKLDGRFVSWRKQPDDQLVLSHFDLYLCEKSKTNISSKPGDQFSETSGPIQIKFHVKTPSG